MTQQPNSNSSSSSQGSSKRNFRPPSDFADFSDPTATTSKVDPESQLQPLEELEITSAQEEQKIISSAASSAPDPLDTSNISIPSVPFESSASTMPTHQRAVVKQLAKPNPEEARMLELKARYLPEALKKVDVSLFEPEHKSRFAEEVADIVDAKLAEENEAISDELFTKIVTAIVSELSGYGPLQKFLDDSSIIEIMVNGPGKIYVEKDGKISMTSASFTSQASLRQLIDRVLAAVGRHVDDITPICDARLPDGSRVNVVITPCAVEGPNITIRKFPPKRFTMEKLIESKTISKGMAMFLQSAIRGKLNIVVCGATGSGKTTLLNALSVYIPSHERVITIEDSAELQLDQQHVVRLETRPPDLQGHGAVTIRDLVRTSLRMRPDRVIVGECRGAEALDMIQAMNTGHAGSLTTIHANSPRDAVSRLSTLILTAGIDMPEKAVRDQIVGSIDLFVQLTRLPDGSRRVTYITEVLGIEGNNISLQDLFRFEQTGMSANGKVYGTLKGCGILPRCLEKMRAYGENLSIDFFQAAIDVP